jgi:hypothetical protein
MLESRQMMAVFNGTSGSDTIRLYLAAGVPHVVINGSDFSTLESTVEVNAHGGDDDIHMDGWVPGTSVDLGLGWDEVFYGGSSSVLFGELTTATIFGDPGGGDDVYLRDSGGGTTSRSYNYTPTAVMNQTLVNIEAIDLDTRPGNAGFPNTINITGTPSTFLSSMSGVATLNVGSSSVPIDIDELSVRFTTDLVGDKNYYNEDSNGTNQPFVLENIDLSGPQIQDLKKGGFRISHYENYDNDGTPVNMFIFGGSTVDQFDIAGLVPASTVVCYGAGGNDICRTTNGGWSSQNDDIDEVFEGTLFAYFGGSGTADYLDLNDINDETGDGDSVYQLTATQFMKNAVPFVTFDASTERIQVIGDQGPNDIHFATNPNSQVTIGGAGGNDSLYAGNFSALSSYAATTTISGGDGTDLLDIDTANDSAITEYEFSNGNLFSWRVGATTRSMLYDSTLEQFEMVQNTAGTPTNLRRIAPTLAITIDANTGNDTFSIGGGDLDSNGFAHLTVAGAGGTDTIEFDDSLDTATPGETETYTWTTTGLSKGPAVSIVYGGFESQNLKTGGVNASPSVPNVVNLNSNNIQTSITGSGNRPTTINLTQGNLNSLTGNITISMPPGPGDVLNFNDQNNTDSNVEYQLTNTTFLRSVGAIITHFMNFAGVNQRNLNANSLNNDFGVFSTLAGETTTFNGGGGNDTFYVGQGNLDNQLLGDIILVGGPGSDTVRLNNTSDTSLETQTLNGGSFTDGTTTYWSSVEAIRVLTGPGGSNLNVTAVTVPVIIDGNLGNDTVSVGAGNLDISFFAALTFNGGGGFDSLLIDDRLDGGTDNYDMLAGLFRKFAATQSPNIEWDGAVEKQTLQANSGSNFIFVGTVINSEMDLFANAGDDTVYTNGGHDILVDTGSETTGDALIVNADGISASVQIDTADRIRDVQVNPGGVLQILEGGVLDIAGSLSNRFGGTIDMAGGAMILRNSVVLNAAPITAAAIRTLIIRGHNGGGWNGTHAQGAINSSLAAGSAVQDAVGYWRETAPPISTIGPYAIAANDALVRYALAGDADLDGTVNLNDFNRLAAKFGQSGKVWIDGDTNYDGLVNLADFDRLAANFGQTAITAEPDSAGAGGSLRSRLVELE